MEPPLLQVSSADMPLSEPSLAHEEEKRSEIESTSQVEELKKCEHHIPSLVDEGDPTMKATTLEITYRTQRRNEQDEVMIMGEFNEWVPDYMLIDKNKSSTNSYVYQYQVKVPANFKYRYQLIVNYQQ